MKSKAVFALLLLLSLSGCVTTSNNQLIVDPTPLGKNLFNSISPDQFESGTFTSSRGTKLAYRVLRPSYAVADRAYPLVVQLHGSGGIGTDNLGQMERMAKSWAMPEIRTRYQSFVLVPQFPIRSANYGPASPDQHAVASAALADLLELVEKFAASQPVDSSRIYATGFSMGGSAAWLLPQLAPEMFAAIVPFSGIAPPDIQAGNFVDLPILAIHGNMDTENPITADRRFIKAIRDQGGKKVTLREYQGLEHQPPADAYPGFWWRDWLFQKHRK